jgi:hypothetical protein
LAQRAEGVEREIHSWSLCSSPRCTNLSKSLSPSELSVFLQIRS